MNGSQGLARLRYRAVHVDRQVLRLLLQQQVLRPDLLVGRDELRELLLQLRVAQQALA